MATHVGTATPRLTDLYNYITRWWPSHTGQTCMAVSIQFPGNVIPQRKFKVEELIRR